MTMTFTVRQGEYLAFIARYTARHGVAPSFEDIGGHFGTSSPSVNGMIKTLERRGLISRVPGAARSLRVLVPASSLTGSDYGRGARRGGSAVRGAAALTPADAAFAAAIAVLDTLMPAVSSTASAGLAEDAARAAGQALAKLGLTSDEAQAVAARVAAEVARWQADGRGTVLRRHWVRRSPR